MVCDTTVYWILCVYLLILLIVLKHHNIRMHTRILQIVHCTLITEHYGIM